MKQGTDTPLFGARRLMDRLRARELAVAEGAERGWVHAVVLAWQRHRLHSKRLADRPKDRVFLKRYRALLKEEG